MWKLWHFIRIVFFQPLNEVQNLQVVFYKSSTVWQGEAQNMRSEPFDATRAAGFEQLANVFASSVALHYAKILVSLKIKTVRI